MIHIKAGNALNVSARRYNERAGLSEVTGFTAHCLGVLLMQVATIDGISLWHHICLIFTS